jgi:mitochondrial import inner membrane translocase subunit TIM22
MASSRKPEIDSDGEEQSDNYGDRNVSPNPNGVVASAPGPLVCMTRFACDAVGGAVLGSIFGYGLFSISLISCFSILLFNRSAFICDFC